MKVVEKPDGINSQISEDEVGFLLTNRKGGFCLMSRFAKSRFEGIFFRDGENLYKTVSLFSHNSPVRSVVNRLWSVTREREDVTEHFFMPSGSDSVVYELDKKAEFDLVMDCKEIYDNREWGREYELTKSRGCLVIKFSKRNDSREINSKFNKEFDIYTAVYSGDLEFKPVNEWEKHFYETDKMRDSLPFERHVFKPCRIKCSGAAFAFSTDMKKAVAEAKYIWRKRKSLKKEAEKYAMNLIHRKKIPENDIAVAYQCSLNAVDSMRIKNEGFMAGLPWFYQIWARDELISLKSVMRTGDYKLVRNILFKHLGRIGSDAKLATMDIDSELSSADGTLWLFKRIEDFIDLLESEKKTRKYLGNSDIAKISEKLEIVISQWMKYYNEKGLIVNGPKETWMDTDYGGDSRDGARIEMQCLFLACLRLMRKLGKPEKLEISLAEAVRENLFDGKKLYDGKDDPVARPNIFIAAYAYPELMTPKEWEKCFENALGKLWLKWGGLSTIDKKNPLYTSICTGENPKSYHRGDSWFWINNLAALVMHRINRKKFRSYIDSILKASTESIIYMGVAGYSAELSSAAEQRSEGCMCQLWSSAMYIELVDEIF